MMQRSVPVLAASSLFMFSASAATEPEGDGAPHIAIADDGGELEVEFEVQAGLDESGPIPVLTLDASVFDPAFLGFRTFPVNSTTSPNDDLGFVSEVEGAAEEGGVISGNIVIQLLDRSDNFAAFLGINSLFDAPGSELSLGTSFDTHPVWVALNEEDDLTPATASFEIFNVGTGPIGSGATSLGQFGLVLAVPEPTTAGIFALGALLATRRRRTV